MLEYYIALCSSSEVSVNDITAVRCIEPVFGGVEVYIWHLVGDGKHGVASFDDLPFA